MKKETICKIFYVITSLYILGMFILMFFMEEFTISICVTKIITSWWHTIIICVNLVLSCIKAFNSKTKIEDYRFIEHIKNLLIRFLIFMDLIYIYIIVKQWVLIRLLEKDCMDKIDSFVASSLGLILAILVVTYCIRYIFKIPYKLFLGFLLLSICIGWLDKENWQLIALIVVFINIFLNYDNMKNIYLYSYRNNKSKYKIAKRRVERNEIQDKVKLVYFAIILSIFTIVLYITIVFTEKFCKHNGDIYTIIELGMLRSAAISVFSVVLEIIIIIFRNKIKNMIINIFES